MNQKFVFSFKVTSEPPLPKLRASSFTLGQVIILGICSPFGLGNADTGPLGLWLPVEIRHN